MPPPRHSYHHIRHPSEARSRAGTVSPLSSPLSTLSTFSSLRTASARASRSLRRKRGAWERPVSPLSDTYEEEDAEALREAAAAGVPFLEMGNVEGEGSRGWEGSREGVGTGGWGVPGGSGFDVQGGLRDGNFGASREGYAGTSGDGYVAVPEVGHIRDSTGTERGSEEGGRRRGVAQSGTEVYEAALESGWRPGYLRRRVILSFAAVFAVLLTIIEVLAGLDKARGGLGDGSVSILWGYVPTIRESLRTHLPFSYPLVLTSDTSSRHRRCALGKVEVPSKAVHPLDPPQPGSEPRRHRRAPPRLRERLAADCALHVDTKEALSRAGPASYVAPAHCRHRTFHGRVCEGGGNGGEGKCAGCVPGSVHTGE